MSGECTGHFLSLQHIEILEGDGRILTAADENSGVQALIPGMNFTRRGSINTWIVGAEWLTSLRTSGVAYTELQIWRRVSEHRLTKVAWTQLMIEARNINGVYSYHLDDPLEFEEGDVFGFYQPSNLSNINTLLRESSSFMASYSTTCNVETPPLYFSTFHQPCTLRPRALPLVALDASKSKKNINMT